MTTTIRLVKNDTAPDVDFTLTDAQTGGAINVSNAGDVVRLYFRLKGATALKATITCTKPNGGADGVVRAVWPALSLDTAGEFEGEIEITFSSGKKQTVYNKINFSVRDEIG